MPCILAGNDCSVGCEQPKCVHKFAALSTSSAEALFHIHVVHLDCPLHSPVSSSFPLSCFSVSSHIKEALPFIVPVGADKSLARPGRKQARKHVRDVRDFNNIEM